MMPKLIALARRRMAGSMPSIGTPNISRRGHGVDVEPVGEGLAQASGCRRYGRARAARSGCNRPRSASCPWRRHEGRADRAAFRRAHRDVLQIGSSEDSRPVDGRGERIGGVHAARLGMDIGRAARRYRSILSLASCAPVEHLARQLVPLGRQAPRARRHRCSRRRSWCLPAAGQAHLAEQDVAELLGRADIEVLAGKLADLVLEPRDGLGERAGEAAPASRARP